MSFSKCITYFVIILSFSSFKRDQSPKLRYTNWISLKVKEPSDIAVAPNGKTFFVVSDDQAAVYEMDVTGKIVRNSLTLGVDLEAVCARPDYLFVVDETPRKIYQLNYSDLSVVRTFIVPYSGGRNKGFESITFNEEKKCFVLITEKDPVYIFELDKDFKVINEYSWSKSRDISAATFYNGFVYLLSDEDMTVFKCKASNYEVLEKYRINVHNPEGIAMYNNQMLLVADDLERLYFFNQPN